MGKSIRSVVKFGVDMKCWHCATKLIWGGDHDDEDGEGNKMIVTNLSCPKCNTVVLVYYTITETKE